jgi:hypothetical protein
LISWTAPSFAPGVVAQLVAAYQAHRQRWVDQLQRDLRHVDPARTGALAQVLTIARAADLHRWRG